MNRSLHEIRLKAVPILKAAGVTRSAIFGSYVRGEQTPASDVDILLDFPRGKGLFGLAELTFALEASLGRSVDLVEYDSLHPLLRERILGERVPIL